MAMRKKSWNIMALFTPTLLFTAPPNPTNAGPYPACDNDASCHDAAVRAANAVNEQLPGLPASIPAQLKLYFELVQRAAQRPPDAHRFFYGTNYDNFGELRLPKGSGPFPVAIIVHGGGWQEHVTLDYMEPLAQALTCAGTATWTIEYRRLGGHGEWPAMFQDVAAAADFLRELAMYYPLDLNRVVTVGHSSGGHLALWLAARDRLPSNAQLYTPEPLPVGGAVSLDGIPDLETFIKAVPAYYDSIVELLGPGSAEEIARRMEQVSPADLLPLGKQQVLISGGHDPYVPLQTAEEYVPKALAAGDRVKLIVLPGAGHFESADPADPQAWSSVREAVLSMVGLLSPPDGRK